MVGLSPREIVMPVWSQRLTVDNIEEVGERLRGLLEDKIYVFVSTSERNGFVPDVFAGQRLARGKAITVSIIRKDFGILTVNDGDIWQVTTGQNLPRERPFETPQVTFYNDKVRISHRSRDGSVLHWVIIVTGNIPEEALS